MNSCYITGLCKISAKTGSVEMYLQACVVFVSWKQPLPVGSLIFSIMKNSCDLLFAKLFQLHCLL